MILQSLAALYEDLAAKGTLDLPGWSPVKVSWGLDLSRDGSIQYIVPYQEEVERGKKKVWGPVVMNLPAPVKRTVGIDPNFLYDNSSYVLGVDDKGKPARSRQCFEAFRQRHHELLDGLAHPAAQALLRFLDGWSPEMATQHPVLAPYMEELCKGVNIIFLFDGEMLHTIPEIKEIWQLHFSDDGDAKLMQCLVYGKRLPVQILHPSIKGVQGAQSSGASLVSFNASSLESYGCDGGQGRNAPVSTQAAFAYGAALNYLIAHPDHHLRMGDTTVVYWAEGGEEAYADFLGSILGSSTISNKELGDTIKDIAKGKAANWKGVLLNPENRFFILGLAPNAARLSVRFFLHHAYGDLMKNVVRHQEHLEIIKPAYDQWNELSVWWLLNETVNQKSKDKQPSPQLAGDLARAIWMGTPYPATLYEQTQIRIRAEHKVTRGRAAIIKAYLTRQPNYTNKEVLTVSLNEESRSAPYLLGRLFSVLEALQEEANPGINATIRDRYFNAACATPVIVFPTLIKLAQTHLKKLKTGRKIHYDKQIGQILAALENGYPARLNLQDQGVFQIGYYHQTQKRFTKKEDESNG
ncbi:MAG: type I-C CRISPR-associated protein Cas8c/Csd1 [Clostridia bacterium]|nr:type I-C CRISPR-associated protein Cas8c/Csd1 [Clostridia bacterium]